MTFFGRRKVRQELHCHACDKYVQFIIDRSLDGNHVLNCPNCGHEHCRVVKDGLITDDRWDHRNGPTHTVAQSATAWTINTTCSSTSSAYFTLMTDNLRDRDGMIDNGVRPYRRAHKPITSAMTVDEHARLAALALRAGTPTSTYVTQLLRDHLAAQPSESL